MEEAQRQRLHDLRKALLNLHKTLIDWERAAYEKVHGRMTPGAMLDALMNDSQFAWLRPVSELIVQIDESLEIDALDGPEVDVDLLVAHARALTTPDEQGPPHAQRYHTALQEHPDAVLAHRAVMTILNPRS